jgi:hypothetical protein
MNVIDVNFRDFISAAQAAEMMGVRIYYLHRLNTAGWLKPAGKIGSANVYRRRDIERYIEAHPRLGRNRTAL